MQPRRGASITGVHNERLWLAGALALTLLFTARAMGPVFGPDPVIQDDARYYVIWMARFRDPELFRGDLIADYYQSVTPPGYRAFSWVLSQLVEPLLALQLLPPLLGLAAALFTFLLVRRLHPAPAAAFLATGLLSWYVWQYDDLVSGGPRAFALPLLAALLWSLAAARPWLALGLTVLAALFYPVAGLLGVGLLAARLVRLGTWPPRLTGQRSAWAVFVAATILAGTVIPLGQVDSARFGPVVSAEQARAMPDFRDDGRHTYFVEDAYRFWITSPHSGLDTRVVDAFLFRKVPILFDYLALAALLPGLLLLRGRSSAVRQLGRQSAILVQLLAASFALYLLAHVLFFGLYFPGRYVKWTLPLALAIAAGLALGILAEVLAGRARADRRSLVSGGVAVALGLVLVVYPTRYPTSFVRDRHPTITDYVRAQPPDTLVVGIPSDTDLVPALASRPILVGLEYLLPFHLGYYGEMRARMDDLIEAYYAESPRQVADFAARYGVGLFLVNRAAFKRESFDDAWGNIEPFTSTVGAKLRRGGSFALRELARHCAVADDGRVAVVPATCLDGGGLASAGTHPALTAERSTGPARGRAGPR